MFLNSLRMYFAVVIVWSLLSLSVTAQPVLTEDPTTEAVLRVQVTFTEDANIKVKPQKPKDVDNTEFSLRVNATLERRVRMRRTSGAGVTVDDCMEWSTDGGCKTSFPVTYGGSAVLRSTHRLHSENEPDALLDVIDQDATAEFSGIATKESEVSVPTENVSSIQVHLAFGMKGGCQSALTHNYATMDASTNPPRAQNHSDKKTAKSCSDADWLPINYGPDAFAGITADKSTDKPETRELELTAVACNNNVEYCATLKKQDPGVLTGQIESGWFGGTVNGDVKTGYNFSLISPKDLTKSKMPEASDGNWKQHLTVTATITPASKIKGATALSEHERIDMDDDRTVSLVVSVPAVLG